MNKYFLMLVLSTVTFVSIADNLAPSSSGAIQGNQNSSTERRIKIYQRTSAVINVLTTGLRAQKSLSIQVGDITRGQVRTTVSFHANGDVYKTVSLRQGDVIQFKVRGTHYMVKLVYLLNKPIGHDYAIFSIKQTSS